MFPIAQSLGLTPIAVEESRSLAPGFSTFIPYVPDVPMCLSSIPKGTPFPVERSIANTSAFYTGSWDSLLTSREATPPPAGVCNLYTSSVVSATFLESSSSR